MSPQDKLDDGAVKVKVTDEKFKPKYKGTTKGRNGGIPQWTSSERVPPDKIKVESFNE